jgi:hypothetical protein
MQLGAAILHEGGTHGRRVAALALIAATAAGFITYMVLAVPVAAPPLPDGRVLFFCPLAASPLPRAEVLQYWPAAVIGALVVIAVDAFVLLTMYRRTRRAGVAGPAGASQAPSTRSPLRLDRVPVRVAAVTAAASLTLLVAGLTQGYAMWIPVGFALLPWVPLVAIEAVWKYEHYGLWANFGVVVLLQIGHMGEHTVQVSQLLLYDGQLDQSHGVFGQLDFEAVHFFWDSAIWLILCLVLTRFGRSNFWLWVAFGAASLHQVEHLYLFWMYLSHPAFYMQGGFEGIMGNGGLIGSPLARPYLHFAYNLLVVVPMVLAFWDQTKHVHDRTQPALARVRPAASPA